MNKLYTPLMIALFMATPAKAPPGEVNLREQCRRLVAGHYLKVYDQHRRSSQEVTMIEQIRSEISAKLKEAEHQLALTKAKEKNEKFDVETAAKRENYFQIIKSYRKQVADYDELLVKAKSNLSKFGAEEEAFAKEIANVFLIEKLPQKEPSGYPFQVVYKHSCSKFRRLCPLPERMAQDLRDLRIQGELPEACRRYSNYSNL